VDVIHFWLADGENNHCECENCQTKRPADWYVQMLNELDEKMGEAHLATKIVFLIYVDLLWEPQKERIKNPDRFILMFAPITRNYGQNYGDFLECKEELSPYVRNRLQMPKSLSQNLEHLRRWQSLFDGDSFDFDYHLMWAHVGDIGYEKCAENLYMDVRDLKKIGLNGLISCQVQRCFWPSALPFNSMAAALWNRDADFDAVADEYYRAEYGDSAEDVRKALKKLSDSCGLYEKGERLWNRAAAKQGLNMLFEIVKRDPAQTDLRLYTEYLELLFALFEALEANEGQKVKSSSQTLFEWMWTNEMQLQSSLDVHNSVGTISRLIASKGF